MDTFSGMSPFSTEVNQCTSSGFPAGDVFTAYITDSRSLLSTVQS